MFLKQVEEKKAEENASLESESKYLGLANMLDDRLVLLEQERREVQRKVLPKNCLCLAQNMISWQQLVCKGMGFCLKRFSSAE